jgi:hypothetical protein
VSNRFVRGESSFSQLKEYRYYQGKESNLKARQIPVPSKMTARSDNIGISSFPEKYRQESAEA